MSRLAVHPIEAFGWAEAMHAPMFMRVWFPEYGERARDAAWPAAGTR